MNNAGAKDNITLAVTLIIASQIFSASVMTAVKVVAVNWPTLDVIFVSYCIAAICVTVMIFIKGDIGFKSQHLTLQLSRSLFGVLYFGGLFWAVTYIPVADTMVLRSTAPIWAPFIAYLWLRQPFHKDLWPRILIAFAGVVLVLHPTIVGINFGYLIGLIAAVSYAINAMLIRQLNQLNEPLMRTLFYAFSMPALVLLPYMLTHLPDAVTGFDIALLLFISLGTLTLLLLYVAALKYASMLIILPLTYTGVVFAGIYDWLLWSQTPNIITMAGMALVLVGCYLIVRRESH